MKIFDILLRRYHRHLFINNKSISEIAKNTSGFKVYDMSFPMDLECSVHAFLKHPLHAILLYHCRPPPPISKCAL